MEELANKIQTVINTLNGGIKGIPTTYENMVVLIGCIQTLAEVRDKLREETEEVDDGNA